MTIQEILAEVDDLKPNQYTDAAKIKWLSELDGKLYQEIIETHADPEKEDLTPYSEDDVAVELLIDEPHCDVYRYYLFAMIDFMNGETDRYTNSMLMYNNAEQQFANWYQRTHLPLTTNFELF